MPMKLKKIFALSLAHILALGVCLAFASCGTPDDDGTNDECTSHVDSDGDGICDTDGCGAAVTPSPAPSGDYFNENGELILYKGGVPTFKIIKGGDVSDVAADVDDLAATLSKLSASTVVAGNQDTEVQAVEILVGSVTNRGDEYKINKYTLGEKGYMVKQIGTKIVVQGGSKTGLKTAVDYLKETVFGIRKTNDNFTDFAMAAKNNIESPQTGYSVTGVTVAGTPLAEFSVVYPKGDSNAKKVAEKFQSDIYSFAGIRVEAYREDKYEGTGKPLPFALLKTTAWAAASTPTLTRTATSLWNVSTETGTTTSQKSSSPTASTRRRARLPLPRTTNTHPTCVISTTPTSAQ